MDAVKGFILAPFWTIFVYSRFLLGLVFCLPVLFYKLIFNREFLRKHTELYSLLNSVWLGSYVFDGIIGLVAPYSSSIHSHVKEMRRGYVRVEMTEYPWLKNPFNSIHAIALANLGELCSGLSMVSSMQHITDRKVRGIISKIEIEYHKKARGVITGETTDVADEVRSDCEMVAVSLLKDQNGDLVATCKAQWTFKVYAMEKEK